MLIRLLAERENGIYSVFDSSCYLLNYQHIPLIMKGGSVITK